MDFLSDCSGWVYGLGTESSMMSASGMRKCLLESGDVCCRVVFVDPLFGYVTTVIALEFKEGKPGFKFHFGTDGSGYDAIIIPDGGA